MSWFGMMIQPPPPEDSLTLPKPSTTSPKLKPKSSDPLYSTVTSSSSASTATASPSSTPSLRQLSPAELEQLKSENLQLRQTLQQLTQKISQTKGTESGSGLSFQKLEGVKGFMITPPNSDSTRPLLPDQQVQDFYQQLKASLQQQQKSSTVHTSTLTPTVSSASCTTTTSSTSSPASPIDATTLSNRILRDDTSVVVTSAGSEGRREGEEEEVAVLDLNDVEWWTIVNPTESDKHIREVQDETFEEDDFVVVNERDYVEALADFISKSIRTHHPEAAAVSPEHLRKMLGGSLDGLKQPGTIGTVWQYGKLCYSTYGWASTAISLYKDPTLIRLVASGVIKAASWILVLVI